MVIEHRNTYMRKTWNRVQEQVYSTKNYILIIIHHILIRIVGIKSIIWTIEENQVYLFKHCIVKNDFLKNFIRLLLHSIRISINILNV